MKYLQQFTLVEITIFATVIGIAASLGIPYYQDTLKRTHITSGLQLVTGIKASLITYWSTNGHWPNSPHKLGLESHNIQSDSVENIQFETRDHGNLRINITYRTGIIRDDTTSILHLETITTPSQASLAWRCYAGENMKQKYVPENCR